MATFTPSYWAVHGLQRVMYFNKSYEVLLLECPILLAFAAAALMAAIPCSAVAETSRAPSDIAQSYSAPSSDRLPPSPSGNGVTKRLLKRLYYVPNERV